MSGVLAYLCVLDLELCYSPVVFLSIVKYFKWQKHRNAKQCGILGGKDSTFMTESCGRHDHRIVNCSILEVCKFCVCQCTTFRQIVHYLRHPASTAYFHQSVMAISLQDSEKTRLPDLQSKSKQIR